MNGPTCLAYWKKDTVFIHTKAGEVLAETAAQTYPAGFLLTAFLALPPTWLPHLVRALGHGDREALEDLDRISSEHGADLIRRLLVDEWQATDLPYLRAQFPETYQNAAYFYQRLLVWHLAQHMEEQVSIRAFPDGLERYLRRQLKTRQFFTRNTSGETLRTGYRIDRLEDLLHLDSLALWANDATISRCAHCNRFFINPPKQHFNYCDWPATNGKGCRSHGPMQKHVRSVENDPVLKTYRKIYRKHYARHERALSRDGRTEQTVSELLAFKDWSRAAHEVRQRYLRKELDPDECLDRLNLLDRTPSASLLSAAPDARDTTP